MQKLLISLCACSAMCSPAFAAQDFTQVAAAVTEVSAGNYSFTLGGFGAGGQVTGSFSGSGDANGQVNAFAGTLIAFSASFSGNSQVEAFTLGLSDVNGLVYTIGNPNWGTDASYAREGFFGYNAAGSGLRFGPGPNSFCNEGVNCGFVDGPAAAGGVPEPANWAMLIAGFGLIGAVSRRRRAAQLVA
jgi:hypothetical protein